MRTLLLTFFSFLTLLAVATPAWAADVVDPKPFGELLSSYVDRRGRVDYAGLKANEADRKKLDDFVAAVGAAKVEGSDAAQLGFYINAYNAIVIKAVVDRYPIESVMKVDGFFKTLKFKVGGKDVSLDALENEVIRKQFKEPRIHFVLVCGAESCPRLQRKAVTEANLEDVLQSAASEFIPKATKITKGKVVTSKLFEWFAADFTAASGSVREYLVKYLPQHADALRDDKTVIAYANYSWKLNVQPPKAKEQPTTQPSAPVKDAK